MSDWLWGELLIAAAVITPEQIGIALTEQKKQKLGKKIGEICVEQGWITPQTVGFFVQFQHQPFPKERYPSLEVCLLQSGLLNAIQIANIQTLCLNNPAMSLSVGELAVLLGYLDSQTWDFLQHCWHYQDTEEESSTASPPGTIAQTPLLPAPEDQPLVSKAAIRTFFGDWHEIWDGDYCAVDG